ncbi:ABC transporter substrate-binding protein [Acidisoma sp. C75]
MRVLGTEITAIPEIQTRAAADLGIKIEFDCLDFLSAQRRAATQPASYDVYDQCFHNLDIVWYWRAIQPIDTLRIKLWDQVSNLTKTGRIAPHATIGAGDAPVTRLYAQADGSLGSRPSRWISMLPTVHNVDSFVYRSDRVGEATTDTWAALFDPAWSGHVALVDEPAIGVFDALLAAEASGEMEPHSAGQLSVGAIDQLIGILSRKRDAGHFLGFWRTALEAADWMSEGDAWIQSAWSPAITNLQRRGIPVVQAVPREGYRAWHGGLCLSSRLSGYMRDVAYDYLNWWLSGYAGAVVARQGYYMSVLDPVKEHLSPAEWRYWYEGVAASETLPAPDGSPIISPGAIRSGGSYWQRFGSVAIWNTTMDEHNYLARLWARLTSGQRIAA